MSVQVPGLGVVEVHSVAQDDPLAAPLIAELAVEYSSRYGRTSAVLLEELSSYPASEFAAPQGALLVLTHRGLPVAGGAFRQLDCVTAELKRIWTSSAHRRLGLGKVVIDQLEREIASRGYRKVYLTTGPRQPEAVALYLSCGYTPLYDRSLTPLEIGKHPFEKFVLRAIPTSQVDNPGAVRRKLDTDHPERLRDLAR